MREYSGRLVEAEASTFVTEADEIERWTYLLFSDNLGPSLIHPRRAVERILGRISGWESLSTRAAFLRQNHIQIGIEQCYRDLTACTVRFMVRRPHSTQNNYSSISFSPGRIVYGAKQRESRAREGTTA